MELLPRHAAETCDTIELTANLSVYLIAKKAARDVIAILSAGADDDLDTNLDFKIFHLLK